MSVNSDIRDGLLALFDNFNTSVDGFSAEVLAVDLSTRSCSVRSISSSAQVDYNGVRLMPQDCDGILYVPKEGSVVIVENAKNMQPYVVMWSELDEILYVVGGTTLRLTPAGLALDGDSFGGLIKVEPLVAKLNALEKEINALKAKFAAWSPVGGDGGAALKTILSATPPIWTTPPMATTTREDIENTKVKHGPGS